MKNISPRLLFGFLALSFFALSSIAQENFANAWPTIDFYTKARIRVAVFDQREYVKSGKKDSSYFGVVRDVYGIPRSVYSASSVPLAEDLEKAISNGFSNAGMDASIADLATRSSRRASAPEEKMLVLTLSEWVSDSYMNSVGFTYKVTAEVYNHEGQRMASVTSENTKTFSSSLEGGRDALTQVLTSKEIVASLSNKKVVSGDR